MRSSRLILSFALFGAACSGVAAPTTGATSSSTTVTTVAGPPAVPVTTATLPPTTAPPTTLAPSTTSTTTSTTSTTTSTTTTVAPGVCPQLDPVPVGSVVFAGVPGDYDGDGLEDVLTTYLDDSGSVWHMRVVFGGGGGVDDVIVDVDPVAPARPIGGFDVDGDGAEEVFITVGAGASTVLVGLYDVGDCFATRVTLEGQPAVFPIGASVGAVSGLSCPEVDFIEEDSASYVAEDEYEAGFAPYRLDGAVLTAFPGDGAGVTADEAFALAILDCGDLTLP